MGRARRDAIDMHRCVMARKRLVLPGYFCARDGGGITPEGCAECISRQPPCQEARRRERLIAARGERSIAQVARETGVTRESLAAYEDGARKPQEKTMRKLAEYYGLRADELFRGRKNDV